MMNNLYEILLDDKKTWFVKLTDGSGIWKGLIYSYGSVSFGNKDDKIPKLKYEWSCHYAPKHLEKINFRDKELEEQLKNLLGRILVDILDQYKDNITLDKETNKLILNFDVAIKDDGK